MAVITISRQMGSLGSEVARRAADLLGYRLVWRELINQAAIRSGAPEAALAAIDELGLLGVCPSPQACAAYRRAVEQVMAELAAAGDVVIIGRAGQMILAKHPDTLHVKVCAPAEIRAERVAQRRKIALSYALAQIEASDRYRRNYLKRFYKVRWDDPHLYDLVLNTGRLSVDAAARLITAAIAFPPAITADPPVQHEPFFHQR